MDEQDLEFLIEAINMAIAVIPTERQGVAWKLIQAKELVFAELVAITKK